MTDQDVAYFTFHIVVACLLASIVMVGLMSILSKFLHLFKREIPMALDFASIESKMTAIGAEFTKLRGDLSAATASAAQIDQLKAELSTANAALEAANAEKAQDQAKIADLEAQATAILTPAA